MKYVVKDRCGKIVKVFPSWKSAYEFKIIMGRYDWKICSWSLLSVVKLEAKFMPGWWNRLTRRTYRIKFVE